MRRLLLALFLLTACEDPLPPVPDGGLFAQQCFHPPDGGIFLTGFPSPIPGCALPAPDAGVLGVSSLGLNQSGTMVIPPSTDGTALPVVFAFHGAYGNGQEARDYFALEGPADGGAIFIYPNATQGTWDIRSNSIDGTRMDQLLRRLSEAYCIDPHRIYITGFSAGAVYTLWLGCNGAQTFRGLAAVAGTDGRFDVSCCKGPISAKIIHGTADTTINYSEGVYSRNDLLVRDGCSGTSSPDGANCSAYACPAPWAVDFCPWSGGHDVPVWAGDEIWRFFDSQR